MGTTMHKRCVQRYVRDMYNDAVPALPLAKGSLSLSCVADLACCCWRVSADVHNPASSAREPIADLTVQIGRNEQYWHHIS